MIDVGGPTSETLGNLTSLSLDTSLTLREELFKQALALNLAFDSDSRVSRRDSKKKPLGIKLAEDVVSLIGCVKNSQDVPRSLLKNGKRSREYLDSQRKTEATLTSEPSGTPQNVPSPTPPVPPSQPQVIQSSKSVSESSRFTSIMKDLNLLKNAVSDLKKSVTSLSKHSLPSTPPNFCHVRVVFPNPSSLTIDIASLSALLGCPVLATLKVGSSLKAKIHKECLFNAIQSSSASSHLVQVWKNKHCNRAPTPIPSQPTSSSAYMGHTLSLGTWNCRGIRNSVPYINHLPRDSGVLVIQEHWLWPFEEDFLRDINKDYSYCSVFDACLHAESTL